jgi:hypothetical protein
VKQVGAGREKTLREIRTEGGVGGLGRGGDGEEIVDVAVEQEETVGAAVPEAGEFDGPDGEGGAGELMRKMGGSWVVERVGR